MNIKALIKTLTPTKTGLFLILGLSVFISLVAVCAVMATIGIWTVLDYMFGQKMAENISTGLIIAFWVWIVIGDPLVSRYKRIKRELEQKS